MPAVGAGFAPAGLASAGFGTLPAATSPSRAVLPDVVTQLPTTGRYINWRTGDYAFTADGRAVGMGTTQQLVLLALTTAVGSSAIPTLGQSYTSVQEKAANYEQDVTARVNAALGDLIKRGFITLQGVSVQEPSPDAAIVQIFWTDLATGTQNTNSFGP